MAYRETSTGGMTMAASDEGRDDEDASRILALLDDSRFIDLRLKADRDVLLWKDMEGLPMPKGYTCEETWKILTSIRHQTASKLPWRSYLDIGYVTDAWYITTRSMAQVINQFEARCRKDSFRQEHGVVLGFL